MKKVFKNFVLPLNLFTLVVTGIVISIYYFYTKIFLSKETIIIGSSLVAFDFIFIILLLITSSMKAKQEHKKFTR